MSGSERRNGGDVGCGLCSAVDLAAVVPGAYAHCPLHNRRSQGPRTPVPGTPQYRVVPDLSQAVLRPAELQRDLYGVVPDSDEPHVRLVSVLNEVEPYLGEAQFAFSERSHVLVTAALTVHCLNYLGSRSLADLRSSDLLDDLYSFITEICDAAVDSRRH